MIPLFQEHNHMLSTKSRSWIYLVFLLLRCLRSDQPNWKLRKPQQHNFFKQPSFHQTDFLICLGSSIIIPLPYFKPRKCSLHQPSQHPFYFCSQEFISAIPSILFCPSLWEGAVMDNKKDLLLWTFSPDWVPLRNPQGLHKRLSFSNPWTFC